MPGFNVHNPARRNELVIHHTCRYLGEIKQSDMTSLLYLIIYTERLTVGISHGSCNADMSEGMFPSTFCKYLSLVGSEVLQVLTVLVFWTKVEF